MVSKREVFVVVILMAIALVRFLFFLPKPPDYRSVVGDTVSMTGVVTEAPDVRLNNIRLTITPEREESNILAVVPLDTRALYGDKVTVTGVLETPENFETSSGKEFNYIRYLSNQDIYYIIKNAEVSVISHKNGSRVMGALYNLRESFMRHINQVINPPESDLGNGLVLGTRGGFDPRTRDEFITTGTIHIVALSGYNVTIVAEALMKILGLVFAQTLAIVFGIIVIILFILLAGAGSTAIRAGIMAAIALFARMTGRTYRAGRALVIAALLMIAYDPRVITDISFQLSFLATAGLLFITPKIYGLVRFLPRRLGIRELGATTLAATIAVLPLLLFSTGILSLVSLPANILILSFIPATMLMIFLTGMAGFLSPLLALGFGYIAHLFLFYILFVIHFFASLPFASLTIHSFPLVLTFALYGLIIWWVWKGS